LCATSVWSAEAADAVQTGATKYTLRYRFHPGETIRWEVMHRNKVDATVSGITQTTETRSKSVKVWQVEDVKPDGTATFKHLVESVDMWHKLSGREEVRYNSRTDEKPPPGYGHLAKSLGVPLSVVTIDTKGRIIKRDQRPVKAGAQSEGPMTIPLPEKPVPVGHTWSVPHTIEVQLNTGAVKTVKTRQQFTLKSVKTGVATIGVATQILTPIDDPALETQLIQCESRGTVRFHVGAGRIIGQQMDADKRVVGHPNPASSFHYLSRFTEAILPPTAKTANRPSDMRR
jgi:hypothetical protein